MAHLPPNTAIFSPSVARAAASAAKDWSYVDSWLLAKFHGRGAPPSFERNADTLRALLALASANEAADESRQQVARLEAEALRELKTYEEAQRKQQDLDHENSITPTTESSSSTVAQDAREAILHAIESSLTREGTTALETMATLSLTLPPFTTTTTKTSSSPPSSIIDLTPASLGTSLLSLSDETAALAQSQSRIDALTRHMASESARTAALLSHLTEPPTSEAYRPPPELARQNLEAQRRIKSLATKQLPDLHAQVGSLSRSIPANDSSFVTVDQVRADEEAYLALQSRKRALDAELQSFEGLPPDADQAREELEALRDELRQMTQRRDAVFEGLVERETPRKPRRV